MIDHFVRIASYCAAFTAVLCAFRFRGHHSNVFPSFAVSSPRGTVRELRCVPSIEMVSRPPRCRLYGSEGHGLAEDLFLPRPEGMWEDMSVGCLLDTVFRLNHPPALVP